jgi:hypothetical protein
VVGDHRGATDFPAVADVVHRAAGDDDRAAAHGPDADGPDPVHDSRTHPDRRVVCDPPGDDGGAVRPTHRPGRYDRPAHRDHGVDHHGRTGDFRADDASEDGPPGHRTRDLPGRPGPQSRREANRRGADRLPRRR